MKILHSWLMDFIDAPLSAEELPGKLARLGFNVESVKRTGANFKGVVVGRIQKIGKHPNADKLSICAVDDGTRVLEVVCGAKNIAEGQKIPFARAGAELAGGTLKKAKIRGVESEGMICSAAELGLEGYNNDGILVLSDSAAVGTDAQSMFPKTDHVFEVEITPNLAYCLSHYALARELCVFYGLPLKEPSAPHIAAPSGITAPVTVADPSLCPRYVAIVIKNVHAAATPAWLADRLRVMEVNPKNNLLIDVSNYVMFELGQPTHCFDLDKLSGPEIKVRGALSGETLKSLDAQDLKLEEGMLVIADKDKPAALAGIIGGMNSAVSDSTKNILIESASFSASSVRRTSKKLGLKTDASYRFERGTDPEMPVRAALRLASIILESAPGAEVVQVLDNYSVKYAPRVIEFTPEKINAILGSDIPETAIAGCLKAIQPGFNVQKPWKFSVPGYRRDMETVWDIAEEAARFVGYDAIPSRSAMTMAQAAVTPSYAAASELRSKMAGLGFSEVCNYDFIALKDFRNCLLNEEESVTLKNPLSMDFQFLRTSMAPTLLKTLRYNLNRGRDSVCIFELGSVYKKSGGEKHSETVSLAALMYGNFPEEHFWKGGSAKADFYHLKGAVEALFGAMPGFRLEKAAHAPAYLRPGAALEMKLGGATLGFMGKLSPEAAANNDFKDNDIYYFEAALAPVAALRKPEFRASVSQARAVSVFPQVWRDLSVVLEEKHEWADIERAVSKAPDLLKVELIDVYRGKNIGENLKSITVRFTFSSMEATLTDAQIGERVSGILEKLSKNFAAKLRS